MTSVNFMNPDEPNFYFKGINAMVDMDLIIEHEIPEVLPQPRIQEIETLGRSGSLHEWHGDYSQFDLKVPDISCPYDRLHEVKRWLRGSGKLVTHNDNDKYRIARCDMSSPIEFENQWGWMYQFDLTFKCQPFKKRLSETKKPLVKGNNKIFNMGDEISHPIFWIEATGGDFTIKIDDRTLTVENAKAGTIEINTEFGKVMPSTFKKGAWPLSTPGENNIVLGGNVKSGLVSLEEVYL